VKIKGEIMKLIRPASVILIGSCITSLTFGQTTVPVKPVANAAVNSSASINNKAESSSLNRTKIKTVDKKKRKPSHVRCIKKPIENTVENQKN
jgi:hypothetical protein